MATTTFTPSASSFFKAGFRNITAAVILILGTIILLDSIRINSPTQVSVVTSLGKITGIQKSGLFYLYYLILPYSFTFIF